MRAGRGAVWTAKRVLYHSGLLALARRLRRRDRAIILRYHAITQGSDVEYAAPDICLPVAALRLQMAFVKRAYRPVDFDTLVRALHAGGALPPRALAVTFDDGYADNFQLAFPVLRELGIPATVFVATGGLDDGEPFWVAAVRVLVLRAREVIALPGLDPMPVPAAGDRSPVVKALVRALVPLDGAERRERLAAAARQAGIDLREALRGTMMTRAQVRELSAGGWTIGAHTVQHGNVALMSLADAEREIVESRDTLAAATGAPVRHFCYPNTGGQHQCVNAAVAELLRRHGFRSGATSVAGAVGPGTDPYGLPRLGVSPRLAPVIELAAAVERRRLAA
ncbi:MAG TPA: polysaccharide deacetylase family protein [Candidatus Limnocylindria bacterium]|nr:polysaccharide deacetylase family protein [Candidatus Limnocylindria bacterium]